MDIFEQAISQDIKINKKSKENHKIFNELESVSKNSDSTLNNLKSSNENTDKNDSEEFIHSEEISYNKLNFLALKISCDKFNSLQNKPYSFKKYKENIFLSNDFFNDFFKIIYYKNKKTIEILTDDSYILKFIEINFGEKLDKYNIQYYYTGLTFINREFLKKYLKNSLNTFNFSDISDIPDIRKCFLCKYYDLENDKCLLN